MDRLQIIKDINLLLVLAVTACGNDKTDAPPPPGRVVAVKAKAEAVEPAREFCDLLDRTGERKLTLPELDAPFTPPPGASRWVNVWATWCKPCIAEMPMLAKWEARMKAEGKAVSLEFLSVDEDQAALGAFLKANPYMKRSLHLKDPEAFAPWLERIGIGDAAGLPIHLFTDTAGRLRCVRAAAISESHYATIAKLLGGG